LIKLLAIDIDGTLLDSRGQLPGAHRDALIDLHASGVDIALATGRSFPFTQPVAALLPMPLTLIVNSGAVVKTRTGRTVLRHLLARDTARQVLAGTRAYEDSVALVFDREPDGPDPHIISQFMDWTHVHRRGYYETNKAFIGRTPAALVDEVTEDLIQVMFNGSVEPMRSLVSGLRALPIADRFSVAITEYERRDFSLVDVNGAGCSKGATLARWVAARGLTAADVMAVGDNLNDVEMLDFAGTAVVMGNATEALKARGYLETASNDEDGLAHAVRRFAFVEPAGG
jgi:Cof subfamily protein (haloacid dehalogenase superfamily)